MTHDLRIERIFRAPPEVVFDAFTDPEARRELYADEPDWMVESECDLRVGGRWRVSFGPPGTPPARETNVFEVIERPRRLVYSSSMALPDGSTVATAMEVVFEKVDGGTRLTIVQRGFETAPARDELEQGWPSILDGLGRVVAARVAG